MSITAKELAKILNLSEAAVSMALRNKQGVSTQTRRKVLEAAEKHGYNFTKSKAKEKHQHITFVIYKHQGNIVGETPFFSELFEGIETACTARQYRLQITYIHRHDKVSNKIDEIISSECAGIILLGTEMQKEDFKHFEGLPIPLVVLDAYFDFLTHDCVLINNIQGALMATNYLIDLTGKQPGYLRSSYSVGNYDERADGFFKALRQHGMSDSKSIIHKLSPSSEGAYTDMHEIIKRNEKLASCYFADNDLIAIGAMKAFQRNGIKIPEDIAIIGFDNISMTAFIEPSLTTVHVPKKYMGEMAVKRLVEIINAKAKNMNLPPVKIEVYTELKKRKSV